MECSSEPDADGEEAGAGFIGVGGGETPSEETPAMSSTPILGVAGISPV